KDMLYRINKKDLFLEAGIAKNSKKLVVFCAGFPYSPCKKELAEFFMNNGFSFFFPRYNGTWEAYGKGKFSLSSAIETIRKAIKFAKKERAREAFANTVLRWRCNKIFLLADSFGCYVANSIRKNEIKNALLFSPPSLRFADIKEDILRMLAAISRGAFGRCFNINEKRLISELKEMEQYHCYNWPTAGFTEDPLQYSKIDFALRGKKHGLSEFFRADTDKFSELVRRFFV
ncbi:MAG: hypothetical protein J7L14_01015, partial [Candidatus Diapherotrites archaeon]|nr:hypothetical protein [Candidatus Diapherotrites archaeon]